jgi:hypothetical protein
MSPIGVPAALVAAMLLTLAIGCADDDDGDFGGEGSP